MGIVVYSLFMGNAGFISLTVSNLQDRCMTCVNPKFVARAVQEGSFRGLGVIEPGSCGLGV